MTRADLLDLAMKARTIKLLLEGKLGGSRVQRIDGARGLAEDILARIGEVDPGVLAELEGLIGNPSSTKASS